MTSSTSQDAFPAALPISSPEIAGSIAHPLFPVQAGLGAVMANAPQSPRPRRIPRSPLQDGGANFTGLVKTASGKMGKILGQRHKRVGPRQAAGRLKQQPRPDTGQGDFAIILEAPDHVPQMPIIKRHERHARPRSGHWRSPSHKMGIEDRRSKDRPAPCMAQNDF